MFKRRKQSEPEADTKLASLRPPGAEPAATPTAAPASAPSAPTQAATAPAAPAPAAKAVLKETPNMARSPFSGSSSPTPSIPTPPQNPSGATAPGAGPSAGLRPPGLGATAGAAPARAPSRDAAERRTLVVGRGISVQGTVQDAERLVVEGTVEASMIHAAELAIAHGGVFKGEVEVEDAEIAGTIDGTLTARGSLVVRASGRVLGTARCRRLQVEDGGQITGRIEMLTEQSKSDTVRFTAPAGSTEAAS